MTAAQAGRRCEPEASSLGPTVIQRVQEASAAIHAGRPLAFLDSALSDAMTHTHRLPPRRAVTVRARTKRTAAGRHQSIRAWATKG